MQDEDDEVLNYTRGKTNMNHYTDQLIESLLLETYTSHAAKSDVDRDAAEKAYKQELTNGPVQVITYANGAKYKKNIGSLDLDNLHKAFDKWYEDHGVLDLFDTDGKLLKRGDYVRIKGLDSKEPAVKALFDLWGLQFGISNGLVFLTDKFGKKAEAKKAQELKDKQAEAFEDIKQKILDTKEFKQLKALNDKADIEGNLWKANSNNIFLLIRFINMLMPADTTAQRHAATPSVEITLKDSLPDQEEIDRIIKLSTEEIVKLIKNHQAFNYLQANTENFNSRIEARVTDEDILRDRHVKWFYYDESSKEVYVLTDMEFKHPDNTTKPAKILNTVGLGLNTNGGIVLKKTSKLLSQDLRFIGVEYDHYDESGNCYQKSYFTVALDDKYKNVLKDITNVEPNNMNDGWGLSIYEIELPEDLKRAGLNKCVRTYYELDSSD